MSPLKDTGLYPELFYINISLLYIYNKQPKKKQMILKSEKL